MTDNLDFAIDELERLVGVQLESAHRLSEKAGTLLGLALASFAFLFSASQELLRSNLGAATVSASVLIVSAAGFSLADRLTRCVNAPDPEAVLRRLEAPPEALRSRVLASLAEAIRQNNVIIANHFRFLNLSLAYFVMGVTLYVAGVVMA